MFGIVVSNIECFIFYLLLAASVYFNYTGQAKCLNITEQGNKMCTLVGTVPGIPFFWDPFVFFFLKVDVVSQILLFSIFPTIP